MIRKFYLTACITAVTATVPAMTTQAAGREGTWEMSAGIVFQNSADADFDGGTKAHFDSDEALRLALDYNYTDELQFGLSTTFGQPHYKANVVGDQPGESFTAKGDLDYWTLLLNGTYNFMPGPFTPFVTAGIGWAWVDTNLATDPPEVGCWWSPWYGYICNSWQNTKTLDGFTYQLGAGARYDFNEQFAVRGSYRIDWIELDKAQGTPDFDGFELSFAWKF